MIFKSIPHYLLCTLILEISSIVLSLTSELLVYRYHVPRSWLRASNNLLVILEETGGNPFEISVKVHLSRIICAQVSESNYPPVQKLVNADLIGEEVSANNMIPELQLYCQEGHTISSITFASFGNPRGSCQNFSRGNCHAPSSMSIVSKVTNSILDTLSSTSEK